MAETIENNVRRKIMEEQLTDPAFYATMSALLDEVIQFRKARADEYEAYLTQIAALATRLASGTSAQTPADINTPGRRALYNNLSGYEDWPQAMRRVAEVHSALPSGTGGVRDLTITIDSRVKYVRPDGWRGVQAKERIIKQALFDILRDRGEVERIFAIVVQQPEY